MAVTQWILRGRPDSSLSALDVLVNRAFEDHPVQVAFGALVASCAGGAVSS